MSRGANECLQQTTPSAFWYLPSLPAGKCEKEKGGRVVFEAMVAFPLSAQHQVCDNSEYGRETFNYILPVSQSRHPRNNDKSNLAALLGARAEQQPHFTDGKIQSPTRYVTQLRPQQKSAISPGRAA